MSNESKSGGVGIFTVVGVVFIILKLCGLINWSWVWVLSPFWMPVALILVIGIIAVIIGKLDE